MKPRPRWIFAALAALLLVTLTGDWVGPAPADSQGVVQTLRSATVDTREAEAYSTNFCRVRDTTEEIIIDFGLNDEAPAAPTRPIKIDSRVVMSPAAAKRLYTALEVTLAAHERTFGKIEIDPLKRVKPLP
jgi:hypothetical protein